MSTPADRTIDDPNSLFRFALLLTGDAQTAGNAVLTALKKAGGRIAQVRDSKRRRALLMEQIQAAAPASSPRVEPSPFAELPDDISSLTESTAVSRIAQLPEPLRTAAAFFYSNLFSAEELPLALGWSPSRTADVLQQARLALLASPQNPDSAPIAS